MEIETFVAHRPWRKYRAYLEEPHEETKAKRVLTERAAGPGAHAFIRVHGWSALGFPG